MLATSPSSLYLYSCQPPGSPGVHASPAGTRCSHCPGLADPLMMHLPISTAVVSAVLSMCPDLLPQLAVKTFPFSTSYLQLYLLSGLPWSGSTIAMSDTDSKEETEKLQKVGEGDPFGAEANVSFAKYLQGLSSRGSLRSLLTCHLIIGLLPSLSPSPKPIPLSSFINP